MNHFEKDGHAALESSLGKSLIALPSYLEKTYRWAYVTPFNVSLLDHDFVVHTILWGNSNRLMKDAFSEFQPGAHVLQVAHVYGDFSPRLANHLGAKGTLEVVDIVPLQVKICNAKLTNLPHAHARLADAQSPGGGPYDGICCYFLLHELPEDVRRNVVRRILNLVKPGGRVVFVDYHKPSLYNPLYPVMKLIWKTFEPYAESLLNTEIANLVDNPDFTWNKQSSFGGLYQKVVATRIS